MVEIIFTDKSVTGEDTCEDVCEECGFDYPECECYCICPCDDCDDCEECCFDDDDDGGRSIVVWG